MRTSEWVVVAYFLYLLASGSLLRASARTLLRVCALGAPTAALLVLLARIRPSPIASVLRDWLPGAYVMIGYWATGILYCAPNTRLETGLEAVDVSLFDRLRRLGARLPRIARELFEFAYLCCYPLVPAGVAVLYATGARSRADQYWTLVLVSTFAAYGVLPWAGTRPPRALERLAASPAAPQPPGYFFQRVNLAVLAHGSIQVNTFPSGHAASAWAVALFMTTVPGAPWLGFVLFAGAIGVGAIAGRYHYALDVVAGIFVAVVVFLLIRGVGL